MADENTTQALKAFAGYDQGVFLEWLEGLTDMMQSGGDPGLMDKRAVHKVAGLMYALVLAANELGEREWLEARAR